LFSPTLHNACAEKVKHAGELGYCALCDTVIMDRIDFHIKPNKEYHELWFEFSNGTRGKIAFCSIHYNKIKKLKKISKKLSDEIMDGIRRGWGKEFELNNWSKEQKEKYKKDFFNLKIIRRIPDEEVDKLNNN
jgi:hypothetical protein